MVAAAPDPYSQPPLARSAPGLAELDGPPLDRSRLAGLPRRLGAVLIDGLLAYLPFVPVLVVGAPVVSNVGGATSGALLTVGVGFVASYLALLGYMAYGLVQMGRGRSPGKKLLGLRVIHLETGEPAGFWRMLLREVVGKWVSGAILGLGYLWAIWDNRKQGWHDKIAGTVVLREDPDDAAL